MKILITNDDGIQSVGLCAVLEALRGEAECLVVAPARERSANGHSVTLYEDIAVETVELGGGLTGYAVEGTPVDCVKFAVVELAKEKKPDLVISGINLGFNSGVSIYYSGTVSAAREGLINGIPSIAISQGREQQTDFSYATGLIRRAIRAYQNSMFPPGFLLNINVPGIPPSQVKGARVAKQAASRFMERFEFRGNGSCTNCRKSRLLSSTLEVLDADGTSDEEMIRLGFASVTPLQLDTTDYRQMTDFAAWANAAHMEDWIEK